MSKKHDRTLAGIFNDPLPANVKWRDVEALFVALGAQLVEGRGSRVTVFLNEAKAAPAARCRQGSATGGAALSPSGWCSAGG